jgi:hypothetical protein
MAPDKLRKGHTFGQCRPRVRFLSDANGVRGATFDPHSPRLLPPGVIPSVDELFWVHTEGNRQPPCGVGYGPPLAPFESVYGRPRHPRHLAQLLLAKVPVLPDAPEVRQAGAPAPSRRSLVLAFLHSHSGPPRSAGSSYKRAESARGTARRQSHLATALVVSGGAVTRVPPWHEQGSVLGGGNW